MAFTPFEIPSIGIDAQRFINRASFSLQFDDPLIINILARIVPRFQHSFQAKRSRNGIPDIGGFIVWLLQHIQLVGGELRDGSGITRFDPRPQAGGNRFPNGGNG